MRDPEIVEGASSSSALSPFTYVAGTRPELPVSSLAILTQPDPSSGSRMRTLVPSKHK